MSESIESFLTLGPVIPVLTIEHVEDAVPLARALVKGGLRVLEVTLRTPAALDAIRLIANDVEDAIVGAGTVLSEIDLKHAKEAGARFAVSPGLTKQFARSAVAAGLPLLPGVATASDIMRGLDLGLTYFKFFPAETSGGAAALKAFQGPFAHCRFCPTGGITLESAPRYLALPNVLCVGGTWIAPRELVKARDWAAIALRAREATRLRATTATTEATS
jgi:2-dehydro-3-deoxyphosphogluconate aldolase / (4S)-4-hydroxy-2-oxoglutarate aldolase